jgi:hypothetical protein
MDRAPIRLACATTACPGCAQTMRDRAYEPRRRRPTRQSAPGAYTGASLHCAVPRSSERPHGRSVRAAPRRSTALPLGGRRCLAEEAQAAAAVPRRESSAGPRPPGYLQHFALYAAIRVKFRVTVKPLRCPEPGAHCAPTGPRCPVSGHTTNSSPRRVVGGERCSTPESHCSVFDQPPCGAPSEIRHKHPASLARTVRPAPCDSEFHAGRAIT